VSLNLQVIYSELVSDPLHIGYAGKGPVDQAALLNAPSPTGFTVPVTSVSMDAVKGCFTLNDWEALYQAHPSYIWYFVAMATSKEVNLASSRLVANIEQALNPTGANPPSSPTLLALQALSRRRGSRVEELCAPGDSITPDEVLAAYEQHA
jgi:hypothetical protein